MNIKYRKTIIAGNWKMNMLPSDVKAFSDKLKLNAGKVKFCDILICPPSIMIPTMLRAFNDSRLLVGAQNLSEHEKGAFTGETSAAQLRDAGAKFVIIGHSERRQFFGESDSIVNKKVVAALDNALSPIICVGERLEDRDIGVTMDLIRLQLKNALAGIGFDKIRKVVIAYEPIWAIGTGKTASAEQAAEVCSEIRSLLRSLYGARPARSVSILYGGSMTPDNSAELLAQPDIDGGLIGGASLDPDKLLAIINSANQ